MWCAALGSGAPAASRPGRRSRARSPSARGSRSSWTYAQLARGDVVLAVHQAVEHRQRADRQVDRVDLPASAGVVRGSAAAAIRACTASTEAVAPARYSGHCQRRARRFASGPLLELAAARLPARAAAWLQDLRLARSARRSRRADRGDRGLPRAAARARPSPPAPALRR